MKLWRIVFQYHFQVSRSLAVIALTLKESKSSILITFNLLTRTYNSYTWEIRRIFSRNLKSKYLNIKNILYLLLQLCIYSLKHFKFLLSEICWCKDHTIYQIVHWVYDHDKSIHPFSAFVFLLLQHWYFYLMVLKVTPNEN